MPITCARAVLALTLVSLCTACQAAVAGTPATVGVRVEGQSTTLLPYTTVTTSNTPPPTDSAATGTSAAAALDLATSGRWDRKCFAQTILGETHSFSHNDYWAFWLGRGGGYAYSQSGICQTELAPRDEVLMLADVYASSSTVYPLALTRVPPSVQRGVPFNVTVTEYRTDGTNTVPAGAGGALVSGGGSSATAGPDGQATMTINSSGTFTLTATKASRAPSIPVPVCVHDGDDGNCSTRAPSADRQPGQGPATPTGGPARGPADQILSRSLSGRIIGFPDGHYFLGTGPRLLRASIVAGAAGIAQVRLRLERQWRRRCQGYDGHTERFRPIRCGAAHARWFGAGSESDVSYLLPFALPPGRYVLDLEAMGRDGRRDRPLQRGRNRIVFWVGPGAGRARASRRAPARGGGSPEVLAMVVGRERELVPATRLHARAVTVGVGRRRCAAPSGTALAVIGGLGRLRRLRVLVRDYGSCSSSPRDAGGLFVYQVGSDLNGGQDGWVYKVDNRAGTAAAGDPGGPFGHGRLRSGQRVLWFWCRQRAGACQRTLELAPVPAQVRPGAAVPVAVTGFDDGGRGAPVAGAAVSLGAASAITGSDGRATLTAPAAPGGYRLAATAPGLVPAFGQQVTVR